jgi:hypothetical protein
MQVKELQFQDQQDARRQTIETTVQQQVYRLVVELDGFAFWN